MTSIGGSPLRRSPTTPYQMRPPGTARWPCELKLNSVGGGTTVVANCACPSREERNAAAARQRTHERTHGRTRRPAGPLWRRTSCMAQQLANTKAPRGLRLGAEPRLAGGWSPVVQRAQFFFFPSSGCGAHFFHLILCELYVLLCQQQMNRTAPTRGSNPASPRAKVTSRKSSLEQGSRGIQQPALDAGRLSGSAAPGEETGQGERRCGA